MKRRLAVVFALGILVAPLTGEAQETRPHRVGVITQGGPFHAAVDGLREGLNELGLEEGKQYALEIRDTKGDLKAAEEAARNLEQEKVLLLYVLATSVTMAAKRATREIPIVFGVGTDPVASGFVKSLARPGGRLTGVHYWTTDLTGKRLEVLKEMLPKLRRVVTFYDPSNSSAQQSAGLARDAGRQLRVEVVERPVASVEELHAGLRALRPGEADAFFQVSDAMVFSQAQFIIDTAKAKRLPTMFDRADLAAQGALAGYGVNFREVGRATARYVQGIIAGRTPQDLPIENIRRTAFAINLRTARALGLQIPSRILDGADQVIE